MSLVARLIAALVPLVITPGLLFHFDVTPKIVILLFGVAAMLLFCKQNVGNVRALAADPLGRWFIALLAAGWLSLALSTGFSQDRAFSIFGSAWRRSGFLTESAVLVFALLATAGLARGGHALRGMLRAICGAGGAASAYGIAQYFGLDPFLPAKAYLAGEGPFTIVRPPGTLGHADYFASWLVVIVFGALALDSLEDTRGRKAAARIVAGLASAAIVLSGTRAALLGLVAGVALLAAVRRPRLTPRRAAVVAGLAICLGALLLSPGGEKLRARIHWSLEDLRGGARLFLWRDSCRMAGERWAAGFGPETFALEFPRFESIALARAYPDFYHESPHNVLLDALAGQGLPGALVLLGFCAVGAWAWKMGPKPAASALVCGLGGFLVCQQFSVWIIPTEMYFYLLIGMLVTASNREAPGRPASPRSILWVAAPVSIVAGLAFAAFGVHLFMADRALAGAFRSIAYGNVRAAAAGYKSALAWRPTGAGEDLSYSRAMMQLAARVRAPGDAAQARLEALQAALRATESAGDRQNAWYNLAVLRASNNDPRGVESSLRRAIACSPNWYKPHWMLAQVLALNGRRDEALAEAREAVERNGGRDAQVTETLNGLVHGR